MIQHRDININLNAIRQNATHFMFQLTKKTHPHLILAHPAFGL
jgi:hypothetical protein